MKSLTKFRVLLAVFFARLLHFFDRLSTLGLAAPLRFGALPQSYPTMESFRDAMVAQLGAVEVIRQGLYDYQVYPTAGVAQMTFFQLPIGQGLSSSPGNANAVKQLSDTNMQASGTLPAPQGFFIQSIEVDFQPGSVNTANTYTPQRPGSSLAAPAAATGVVQIGAANDVDAIYNAGSLVLTIGQKPYLQEAPIGLFPPKCRTEVNAAMGGNSATTANFAIAKAVQGGRPYQLTPGLALMTSQNFSVDLRWPVVVATPSGFNGRIGVRLDGWLFRAVQ